MQAHFEHDKSNYPYSVITKGDGKHVVYMPALGEVTQFGLPSPVAERFALDLNVAYWSMQQPRPLVLTRGEIDEHVGIHARMAFRAGEITGTVCDQIIENCVVR